MEYTAEQYLDRIENKRLNSTPLYSRKEMTDFAEKYVKQCDIHVVGSSFYTLEEWGQGSPNRGIIGTYRTKEEAEKDRTDNYWQHIKEHKFK